ncbi:MAG: tetratricopeptide repeat protein [Nitrososphaeraceae archaeon]
MCCCYNAIELSPDNSQAYYNLGVLLSEEGNKTRTKKTLSNCL